MAVIVHVAPPTASILQRLVLLAQESQRVISENVIKGETKTDEYKVIIHVAPPPRRYCSE